MRDRSIFAECPSTLRRKSRPLSREPHIPLVRGLTLLAGCWLVAGCAGETLFQSDFARYHEYPPIGNHKVGSTEIDPLSDQYVRAASDWVVISRENTDPDPRAALLCKFVQFKGDGTYVFSTFLNMYTGTGVATIQFEPFNQPVTSYGDQFLRLDLMPDNTVRIDENDATIFGTFPRKQVFILQVTLKINATPTARILLSGAGASGTFPSGETEEYNILPDYVSLARQYGAVRLWMGSPLNGLF